MKNLICQSEGIRYYFEGKWAGKEIGNNVKNF